MDAPQYRTRLRKKGQVTIPARVRDMLDLHEGDDLLFRVTEEGRVVIEKVRTIPPDQSWFWTERWQRMEREAQADIAAGRVERFEDVDQALDWLHCKAEGAEADAED